MAVGKLRERVTFAQLATASDGFGNQQSSYVDQFTVAARIQYLRGGEQVLAARLEGRQAAVVTIRSSSDADLIKPDWRIQDARDLTVFFNIRSITKGERKDYVDILCETGVALA